MADAVHWSACEDSLRGLVAGQHFGVLSDFDGTLSHFAERPDAAVMTPGNIVALDRLAAEGVFVALLSGRSAGDLRTRFPRPYATYFGNHGLDYWDGTAVTIVEEARPWQVALETLLAEVGPFGDPHILIENKGVTATIHYRAAADPLAASAEIAARVAPLCERFGLQLNRGSQVWEIKPPLALNKGTALATVIGQFGLDSVIFLGDDTTDLLAMAELRRLRALDAGGVAPLRGLSVGVIHGMGSPKELHDFCDITANGPDDVARLLIWLAEQRATMPVVGR
ncbi:MAG TPA: trehalose-phosphatase [Thermomicrobiales bacterium]|jgi:trehalose 6-phosphate phosphatase